MAELIMLKKNEKFFDDRFILVAKEKEKCNHWFTGTLDELAKFIISLEYSLENLENIFKNQCLNCKCWRMKEYVPLSGDEVNKIIEAIREKMIREIEGTDDIISEAIEESYGDNLCYF